MSWRPAAADPGLCAGCKYAQVVTSGRGSSFWRCGVHDLDRAWPKYPPLPVRRCAHFVEGVPEGGVGAGPDAE